MPDKILQSKVILVVDDEEILREVLKDELEYLGATVLEAANGKMAYDVFRTRKIDAVISDIRMPGGDGIELLDKIRSDSSELPIFMLITGFSDLTPEDAYAKGAAALFSKPFQIQAIAEALVKAIAPPETRWDISHDLRASAKMDMTIQLHSMTEMIQTKVSNIGRGGMFIHLEKNFPRVGEIVALHTQLGDKAGDKIEGTAIVRWSRTDTQGPLATGVGVEFLSINPRAIELIVELVKQLNPVAYIPKT